MRPLAALILVWPFLYLGFSASADEAPAAINSAFIGDISNSTIELTQENSSFAGDPWDQDTKQNTDSAFAGDRAFIGNDYGK